VRWFAFFFWFALCFAVAGIGGRWTTAEIAGWYRTLNRPTIAPPNWLFGPVWTVLYGLMAFAAWRVWLAAPSPARNLALALFLAQLALNLAWTWIFFRQHAVGAALIEVIALWAAIAVTMLAFRRVEPRAGWLMAPYLAWVTFASVLNAAFWRLN
jgi:tryptophan-rich sensory protein